jgi:hypothetical protein
MPVKIVKKGGKYYVKKKSTGETEAVVKNHENLKGYLYHKEHGK